MTSFFHVPFRNQRARLTHAAFVLTAELSRRARADSSHSHQYMRIILTEQPQGFQHEPAFL